ncbi:autotransporter-associated beta strand repeat-containing protein [bacterium]|nr:autotransporter-associated beta strand repeat-containing protein [bacterium]
MKKPRFAVGCVFGLLSSLSAFGQVTLNWGGGSTGINSNLSSSGNWLEATAPGGNDLVIAGRRDATPPLDPLPSIPTLLTGGSTGAGTNYSIRSLSMDNAAGRFGSSGLRIGPTTSSTSTTESILTFATAGINILSATNNATTTFWRFNTVGANLTLNLAYAGTGTIVVDGTSRMTFDSVPMTGGGGVDKTGDGRLFTGSASTFTGGATVSGGTWVTNAGSIRDTVTNAINSGPFGRGPVTLGGGTIRSSSETARTYHNGVVLAANSTLGGSVILDALIGPVLTGAQTFTDSASGSTSLTAAVTLNVISNATWNQVITATDSTFAITKTGTGTLTLGRNNSYEGGTEVSEGSLGFGTSGALGSGPVSLHGGTRLGASELSLDPVNPLELLGNVELGGVANVVNRLSGSVDLNGATRSITLGNSTVLGGEISNGGLDLVSTSGTRSLTLAGTNTYAGPTTVSGGRLIVNGSIASNVTVATPASVGGEGLITGDVTVNGSLVPGPTTANVPGILQISGKLALSSGSTASFEILDAATSDRVNVSGAVTLDGTVALVMLPAYVAAAGDRFDLLDSPASPVLGASFALSLPVLPTGLAWDSSSFAGDGVVEIIAVTATPFETWATGYALAGNDALQASDPDHDGFSNLQEFSFGGNPTAATASLVTAEKSGSAFIVTYIARDTDVTYAVKTSGNLTLWSAAVGIVDLGGVDQSGIPAGYTRKQFTREIGSSEYFRVESTTSF